MASYQARHRDPLLDQSTQAALERRGKELLGLCLLGVALLAAMMLASYSPDDPSWLAATDTPARNLLGKFGASVASPLFVIAGLGAWGVALVPGAWGLRFLFHRGEERALNRAIFAPIAVAAMSVYASTHVAGPDWGHSFGLGGLFGDTVLGAILGIVPVQAEFGLKVMAVFLGAGAVALTAFVTGFDRREIAAVWRFLLVGSVMTYAWAVGAAGRGTAATMRGAQGVAERSRERRSMAAAAARRDPSVAAGHPQDAAGAPGSRARTPILRAEPRLAGAVAGTVAAAVPESAEAAAPRLGAVGRLAALVRRMIDPVADPAQRVEPELVEPRLSSAALGAGAPSADRVRARIADAIRAKSDPVSGRIEPTLAGSKPEPRTTPPASVPDDGAGGEEDEEDFDRNAFADLDADEGGDDADIPFGFALRRPEPDARRVVQHGTRRSAPSRKALAEAQPALNFGEVAPAYDLPPLSLLSAPSTVERHQLSDEALEENARMLESVLDDYGVKGEIVSVRPGPVVTMYELEPAPGLKASRVIGLADDIARSMSALSARVSTVPGRSVIGIELPNAVREKVVLREILSSRDFGDGNQRLPLALGKDIAGEAVVANLAKMPHLLIAGTTGSGKSVAINTMILSLLYKLTPEECRLIMIDPKMLELSVYDGIPHLLSPVVTDPKKAVVALKWVVGEMEERYRKMSKMGVRNIEGYNGRVKEALARGEMFKRTVQTGFDEDTGDPVFETEEITPVALPYIVVIVDEMADLMMVAGKEIEACIQRLAQMARASGIHLIMATQRPSVDVITGTIKANFPTRISFQVTSKIDSRTILGEQGAEQLLGMGDMLYMAGGSRITRVHGPFVSDEEVEEIVRHLKSFGPPEYMSGVVEGPDEDKEGDIDLVLGLGGNADGEDALYDQAVAVVLRDRKVSTSYIQRKLGIGYNKAARLVEQMEQEGVVSAANHVGKREILVPEG
ncbi:MAG: DNA translocase FtsK 4TM domain-containing protein [Pseudomonadota bacterium]